MTSFHVGIADGVTIKVAHGAVASVVPQKPSEDPADELAADEPEEN